MNRGAPRYYMDKVPRRRDGCSVNKRLEAGRLRLMHALCRVIHVSHMSMWMSRKRIAESSCTTF